MRFIGRLAELNALNNMYEKNSFEMMILYGRRRVG
jgi:AAA+ ATPase superfamily predicted ATPase